jgi:hypothetical protein
MGAACVVGVDVVVVVVVAVGELVKELAKAGLAYSAACPAGNKLITSP